MLNFRGAAAKLGLNNMRVGLGAVQPPAMSTMVFTPARTRFWTEE